MVASVPSILANVFDVKYYSVKSLAKGLQCVTFFIFFIRKRLKCVAIIFFYGAGYMVFPQLLRDALRESYEAPGESSGNHDGQHSKENVTLEMLASIDWGDCVC